MSARDKAREYAASVPRPKPRDAALLRAPVREMGLPWQQAAVAAAPDLLTHLEALHYDRQQQVEDIRAELGM